MSWRHTRIWSDPKTWLSIVLVVFAMVDLHRSALASAGADFYQFWVVAQIAGKQDAPDIYQPAGRQAVGQAALQRARSHGGREMAAAEFNASIYRDTIEPTATPLLYVMTKLDLAGEYDRDFAGFQLLSNFAALTAIVIFCRLCAFSIVDSLLLAGVIAICFSPLRDDGAHGNTGRLQLLMLALPLIVLARWERSAAMGAVAGILLGVAILYKPNIAAAAPLLLMTRAARGQLKICGALAIGIAIGAGLGAVIGSSGFPGTSPWLAWSRSMAALDYPLAMGNCGGGRILFEITGLHLGGILFCALLLLVAFAMWRPPRSRGAIPSSHSASADDLFAVAIGCLIMLVTSSLAWVHYFIFALPMIVYLLRPTRHDDPTMWDIARKALACLALGMMARVPLQAAFGLTSQRELAGGYVFAAVVLLLAGLYDRFLASHPAARIPQT